MEIGGNFKTYCSGIFELFTKKYYHWLYSRFSFFRTPFFSQVVILTILSQAKHSNRAENGYRGQSVREDNLFLKAGQFFS